MYLVSKFRGDARPAQAANTVHGMETSERLFSIPRNMIVCIKIVMRGFQGRLGNFRPIAHVQLVIHGAAGCERVDISRQFFLGLIILELGINKDFNCSLGLRGY